MWLLVVLVSGGMVGWLASYVMKTSPQRAILANVVAGAVGAGIGNWLGGVLDLGTFGTLGRFLVTMLGAVALIAVSQALKIFR